MGGSVGGEDVQGPARENFVGTGGADLEATERVLAEFVALGLRFKHREKFLPPVQREVIDAIATEAMPQDGMQIADLLSDLESRYLTTMPNFSSPGFMGFPDTGNSIAGIGAAILSDLLNVNMINSTFCSRGATEMEISVIRWLRELVGYENSPDAPESALDVGGMAVSGGTLANFTAVLLARERACPGVIERGPSAITEPLAVVMPERIGHYTIAASLGWSGLGSDCIIYAPVKDFRYDLEALDDLLGRANAEGRKVAMAVVYAGDSRSMTIDRLRAAAAIFRNHFPDIWLHCDGCHGTSLLFLDDRRTILDGISDYDSVTLDPHKVLTIPYSSSFILLKNPADSAAIRTPSDLIMRQARSLGQVTPVLGSRAFTSLKLWALFKALGRRGIAELISHRLNAAHTFAKLIDEHPHFIRINDVNINSVMFMYNPSGMPPPFSAAQVDMLSARTQQVYDALLEDGSIYMHSFRTIDNTNILGQGPGREIAVLRYMGGNPLCDDALMRSVLDHMDQLGQR